MKRLLFLALLPVCALQNDLSGEAGNPTKTPQIEMRVQAVPSNNLPPPQVGADGQDQNTTINNVKPQEMERTLSIIKPDAVKNRHIGDIVSRFEDKGLRIVGIKMLTLDKEQAGNFYKVHRDKPFFPGLVDFMSSGPIVVLVLEGEQAITKNREIMGATDPKQAAPGTIRSDFAKSVSQNAVHGSDSPEAAREEILFFFQPNEVYSNP